MGVWAAFKRRSGPWREVAIETLIEAVRDETLFATADQLLSEASGSVPSEAP
jgi:hypothetical protein